MNLIALAFRNLVRQKRRTALLVIAVAVGFAVVSLLVGLTGGMVTNLQNNLSGAYGGHIFLTAEEWNANGRLVSVITQGAPLEAALGAHKEYIQSFCRRSSVETTLVFGSKTAQSRLTGLEWERETGVRDNLTAAAGTIPEILGPGQILLNTEAATRLGILPGDRLLLKFNTIDGQQNVLDATVAAVIQTSGEGLFNSDSYVSLAQANLMLGIKADQYQVLNLYLKDMNLQATVAALFEQSLETLGKVKLRQVNKTEEDPQESMLDQLLGGDESQAKWSGPRYQVAILDDYLSMFLSLISTIESVALVIFIIMMAVIVIGISNTFQMILRERTVEIGTLRALGVRKKGILLIFLGEALAVLLLGLAGGAILAFLVAAVLSVSPFHLDEVLSLFLFRGRIRFQPDFTRIAIAAAVVLGAGLTAAWRPATHAANLLPADALRHRA